LDRLDHRSQLTSNVPYQSGAVVQHICKCEEIEVVSFTMAQIKSRERGAAAEEESIFAGKEGCQNVVLQTAQLIVFQSAPLAASDQAETPKPPPPPQMRCHSRPFAPDVIWRHEHPNIRVASFTQQLAQQARMLGRRSRGQTLPEFAAGHWFIPQEIGNSSAHNFG
jgi:hypothetical protein